MNNIETARLKYKPEQIKYLLITDAPPKTDSRRFFYYEEVDIQDYLFLEMVQVLYPKLAGKLDTKGIREKKQTFLENFKNDGFYLIESLDEAFDTNPSNSQKLKLIKSKQADLLAKIKTLSDKKTGVILIGAPAYYANHTFLKENGINILNTESIDYPGSGKQEGFREKLKALLY